MADIKLIGYSSGKIKKPNGSTDTINVDDSTRLRFGADNDLQVYHDGTDNHIDSTSALNIATNASVAVSIGNGTSEVTINDNLNVTGNTVISGDLTVNGTTTTVNSSTLSVDDKNLELGSVASQTGQTATLSTGEATVTVSSTSGYIVGASLTKASGTGAFGTDAIISSIDSATQFTASVNHATAGAITFTVGGATNVTADGGGITVKGTQDKTFNYVNTSTSWTSSENLDLANGKEFKINNVSVLSATTLGSNVVSSSLTSVGTLTSLTVDNVSINGTTIGHTDDTDLITLANQSITIAGNANFNISKTAGLQLGGTAVDATAGELNLLNTASAGTVVNSKAVIYSSSGEIAAASLDISGDVDIDGTTNLDAVDIDGATQIDGSVTVGSNTSGQDVTFYGNTSGKSLLWDASEDSLVITGDAEDALKVAGGVDIDGVINVGVNDTGYDVKFFGDTANAYMQWDASTDDLILGGDAGLIVPEGQLTLGSDAVSSTATELNKLDAGVAGASLSGGLSGNDSIIIGDFDANNETKKVLLSDVATFVGTGGGASANNALDTQSLVNKESSTINAGQIVAISAASSIRGLLEADSATEADTEVIGVATNSINANATIGTKIHSAWGKSVSVNKFEVSSDPLTYQDIAIGDKIYLSDTPGKCTTTASETQGHTVYRLGYAVSASGTSTANVTIIWMPQYISSL